MGVMQSKLGNNPLSRGIFSKTEDVSCAGDGKIQETSKKSEDTSFLIDDEREKVNLRLPIRLNDWLDGLLKQGKRKNGQKIPKEIWVQAALELLKATPVDWSQVATRADLQKHLRTLERRINTQDS